jgi:predicted lipid-binding transport protein (Tim44 family)
MKTTTWIALGSAVIVVLFIGLALGTGLTGYGYPGGMLGSWGGYSGPGGMMGGWGWGLGAFLMMGLMSLVPLGFLALMALGIVWLVRQASPPAAQPPATPPPAIDSVCPSCHKGVQGDWQNCPHCGQTLGS